MHWHPQDPATFGAWGIPVAANNRTDTVTSKDTITERTHRNEYLGIF